MRRSLCCLSLFASACGGSQSDTVCKSLTEGALVITELMVDPAGTDTGNEWIEVFNTTDAAIELKGLTLFKRDGASSVRTHLIRAGSVPARGFATLGDVRSGPNPEWITYAYGDALGALPSTGGTLGLRCGASLVLDEVSWTKPPKAGRSRLFTGVGEPSATGNDDEALWCDAPAAPTYTEGNSGTPGQSNPVCQPEVSGGTCLEGGLVRSVVSPEGGDLIITEVMASPSATDTTAEWFEVVASRRVDLNSLRVGVGTSASGSTLTGAECLTVNAGQHAVIARSADAILNGGLPRVAATFGLSLTATNTLLTLSLPDGGLVDEARFPAAVNARAWQLRPEASTASENDDAASFCLAPNRFLADGGGDFGSPGAANPPCPLMSDAGSGDGGPQAGQCVDPLSGLSRAMRKVDAGEVVISEVMADPASVADTQGEWIELLITADADLNGLQVGNMGSLAPALSSPTCLGVDAGARVLFARTSLLATDDGGVPSIGTFSFNLVNSSDTVRAVIDGVELDRYAYTSTRAGYSWQLSAEYSSPADNDVMGRVCQPDAGAIYATSSSGVDRGTPGAVNLSCP